MMILFKSLEELAVEDNLWRNYALKICKDSDLADDLVGRFYIKYHSAAPNIEIGVTKRYVYMSLQNIYRQLFKDKGKLKTTSIDFVDVSNEEKTIFDCEINSVNSFIKKELEKLHFFHRLIFEYIVDDGISITELSKRTLIPYDVVKRSYNETKRILKRKIINEEFN